MQIISDSHTVRAALCDNCAVRKLATVKATDAEIGKETRECTGIPSGSDVRRFVHSLAQSIASWLLNQIPDTGGGTLPPNAFEILAIVVKRLAPRNDLVSERRIPNEGTEDDRQQVIIDHQLKQATASTLTTAFMQKVLTTVRLRDFATHSPEKNARKFSTPS